MSSIDFNDGLKSRNHSSPISIQRQSGGPAPLRPAPEYPQQRNRHCAGRTYDTSRHRLKPTRFVVVTTTEQRAAFGEKHLAKALAEFGVRLILRS